MRKNAYGFIVTPRPLGQGLAFCTLVLCSPNPKDAEIQIFTLKLNSLAYCLSFFLCLSPSRSVCLSLLRPALASAVSREGNPMIC